MEEILVKLREVAEIKSTIAKQESIVWQKVSEALDFYVKHLTSPKQAGAVTPVHGSRYLDTKRAAEYLGLKYGALSGWRFQGKGPKYIKMGGAVRYKVEDLDDFAAKNIATLTPPYVKNSTAGV